MAQADFDFINQINGSPATPSGGLDGTTILHSSLSNPLADNGLYGRQYTWASGNDTTILGCINAGVDGGVWVGTPNTHAISVRITARIESPGALSGSVGVIVKGGDQSASVPSMPSGYQLFLGYQSHGFTNPGADATLTLFMASETTSNFSNVLEVAMPGTFTTQEWHRFRMDVIPVGSSQDVIRVYTSPLAAPGAETWTLIHTEVILSTDAHYANWSDGTANRIGYYVHNNTNASVMIDGFVAMREAV